MSGQTTLGDEDLFGEAAEEMRNEVETHLDDARAALPEADAVWDTDAANILGVLNGFKSALDIEDATSHLRQAKKRLSSVERQTHLTTLNRLNQQLQRYKELLSCLRKRMN